jgi:hypothetical protein
VEIIEVGSQASDNEKGSVTVKYPSMRLSYIPLRSSPLTRRVSIENKGGGRKKTSLFRDSRWVSSVVLASNRREAVAVHQNSLSYHIPELRTQDVA